MLLHYNEYFHDDIDPILSMQHGESVETIMIAITITSFAYNQNPEDSLKLLNLNDYHPSSHTIHYHTSSYVKNKCISWQ